MLINALNENSRCSQDSSSKGECGRGGGQGMLPGGSGIVLFMQKPTGGRVQGEMSIKGRGTAQPKVCRLQGGRKHAALEGQQVESWRH